MTAKPIPVVPLGVPNGSRVLSGLGESITTDVVFVKSTGSVTGSSLANEYEPNGDINKATESHGIHWLPFELLIQVFMESIDLGTPRIHLALVCKYWEDALLKSPVIWNQITLWWEKAGCWIRTSRLPHLWRCLELSKISPLDVTIDKDPSEELKDDPQASFATLAFVLGRCDTCRWRRLIIKHDDVGGIVLKDFRFPSLSSLSILEKDVRGRHFARGIFDSLAQNTTPIEELAIPYGNLGIIGGRIDKSPLKLLRVLTATASAIQKLPVSPCLQELHITDRYSSFNLRSIELPPMVTMSMCSSRTLMTLRLSRIQHLTIKNLEGGLLPEEVTIDFPELESLSVPGSDFCALMYISAPKLRDLCIGTADFIAEDYRLKSNTNTVILLRHLHRYLKVAPRFLSTRLPLTTEATMLLLEGWPQLEKVSIRVAKPFDWRTWLAEGLTRKKRVWDDVRDGVVQQTWKVCPHLRWLHLVTDWGEDESLIWQRCTKAIFRERGDSGLEYISCVYGDGREVVWSRDN